MCKTIVRAFQKTFYIIHKSEFCLWFVYAIKKLCFVSHFSGRIVLNYTATVQPGPYYKEIIADQTTPDAVLLAESSSVFRMYPNGTTEIILGSKNKPGYVRTVKESATRLKKFK